MATSSSALSEQSDEEEITLEGVQPFMYEPKVSTSYSDDS